MIKNINVKSIIKFTIPTIFMMLFMSIYTMVDGIFVANLINEEALSAINIVYPAISIIVALGLMLGTGGNALCAKLLGEGNKEKARDNFSLFAIVGGVIGIVSSILIYFNIDSIIGLLGAEGNVIGYSQEYLRYISWSFPFLILQMIFQTAFITVNKPGLSFGTMFLGGMANIILDYIFLGPLNMGIKGAAIATGIGSSIPAIIGLVFFFRRKQDLYLKLPKLDLKALGKASANGSSEMVGNIATAVVTYLFNITMIRLVGNDGVAAITVILYSQLFLNAVFMGYAMGISPVISYNFGEKNAGNLRKLVMSSIKLILIFSVISAISAVIFAEPITQIFTETSSGVYNLTLEGLRIFAISFIFAGINIFASAMFTAYSNGIVSATISFLRTFVLIIVSILVLPEIIGITGVWLAVPIAEAITSFISIIFILKYKKKYMYSKEIKEEVDNQICENIIITVNREFSSGGREVAKKIAEKLKYAYYDQEIINEIAKNSELDKEYIDKYSEINCNRNYPIKIANSFIKYQERLEIDLQKRQSDIIKELASKGNSVFVGRCSDYILKDLKPFKIFIYSSDMNKKIERCYTKVPQDKSKSINEIKSNILKIDEQRKKYYEYVTGQKINDIHNYNLTIDTSKISIEDAVVLILNICNK